MLLRFFCEKAAKFNENQAGGYVELPITLREAKVNVTTGYRPSTSNIHGTPNLDIPVYRRQSSLKCYLHAAQVCERRENRNIYSRESR